MGETQNLRNNRREKYDPQYGRFVRDVKTTDIVHIYIKASPTTADTVSWDMITYTTDANHALYPYIFSVHHCGSCTCPQVILQTGLSTTDIMAIQPNGNEQHTIITNCECPLTRVAPSSTIQLHMNNMTCTTDTICAWIVAKREPIVAIMEN